MQTISNILNYLYSSDDKRIQTIKQLNNYKQKIIRNINNNGDYDFFSNLDENDKKMIKDIIFNYDYPKKLRPYAIKLYESTDINNLLFCALNLCTIKMQKAYQYKEIDDKIVILDGCYYSKLNKMEYHNKKSIPHEFLHMSSRPIISKNNIRTIGFECITQNGDYSVGINEGYTEMLSRRLFFKEKYNSHSYTTNVFAMRLFELLYENQKDMEKDYFRANFKNLKNRFLKFGTDEELQYIINYLNFNEWETKPNEKLLILYFIKEIVKRTTDIKKIEKAEEISEEFQKIIYKKH